MKTLRVPKDSKNKHKVSARLSEAPETTAIVKSAGPAETAIAESKPDQASEVEKFLAATAGVRDEKLAQLIVRQMGAMQIWCLAEDRVDRLINAAAALREMEPKNATEAMLAVQMFGTHNAAVMFLQRATADGQTFEGVEATVLRATRLMRLFNDQLEAMAKLKGKSGRQKVTIEHVHVQSGGQAVVGLVNASKGEQA